MVFGPTLGFFWVFWDFGKISARRTLVLSGPRISRQKMPGKILPADSGFKFVSCYPSVGKGRGNFSPRTLVLCFGCCLVVRFSCIFQVFFVGVFACFLCVFVGFGYAAAAGFGCVASCRLLSRAGHHRWVPLLVFHALLKCFLCLFLVVFRVYLWCFVCVLVVGLWLVGPRSVLCKSTVSQSVSQELLFQGFSSVIWYLSVSPCFLCVFLCVFDLWKRLLLLVLRILIDKFVCELLYLDHWESAELFNWNI